MFSALGAIASGHSQASTVADSSARTGTKRPGASLQRAHQLREQRLFLDALALCEQLFAENPQDPDVFRLRTLLLGEIGNSFRAWQLYRSRPDLFEPVQRERFELDMLARLIVWSSAYSEDKAAPLADAERTETAIAEYLQAGLPEGMAIPPRLRFDRLILLNRLGKHAQVVDEYRALLGSGYTVPGYALEAVGDSLLAVRMPAEAVLVLEAALTANPASAPLNVQLAYARLENEQPDLAMAALREYAARQPPWNYAPGARTPHANTARYDADTTLAMLSAYSEDVPTAQSALEKMVAIAPADAALQASLGSVYQMRGWPLRALERYRMASTLEDRNVWARIGQVEALAALDRRDLARPIHDELLRTQASVPQVQRMDADWRVQQGWQWRVHAAGGRSDAQEQIVDSASPLGSRDGHHGFDIRSPWLADRWRLTAMLDRRWADFQGQRVHDRRQGVGVAYAFGRLRADLGVQRPYDGPDGMGVDLQLDWRASDVWRVGLEASRHSPEASLQARAAGITADSLAFSASYTPNERRAVELAARQFHYTDGNRRTALSASATQRVRSQPRLLVNVFASAYGSRGSLADVPYFNPSRDASLEAGISLDHLLWRDYDRGLRQRLRLSAGPYWQEGYGTAWIPSVSYRHEWKLATGKTFEYGLNWSRPVYDGQREQRLGFDAEFRWGQ